MESSDDTVFDTFSRIAVDDRTTSSKSQEDVLKAKIEELNKQIQKLEYTLQQERNESMEQYMQFRRDCRYIRNQIRNREVGHAISKAEEYCGDSSDSSDED